MFHFNCNGQYTMNYLKIHSRLKEPEVMQFIYTLQDAILIFHFLYLHYYLLNIFLHFFKILLHLFVLWCIVVIGMHEKDSFISAHELLCNAELLQRITGTMNKLLQPNCAVQSKSYKLADVTFLYIMQHVSPHKRLKDVMQKYACAVDNNARAATFDDILRTFPLVFHFLFA